MYGPVLTYIRATESQTVRRFHNLSQNVRGGGADKISSLRNILPLSKIVGCQMVGHFGLRLGHPNDNNTDMVQSNSLCDPDHFEGQQPLFLPEVDAKILP